MDSTGESSCKGQEDGDGAVGSDRPLKKARFAWQVKGKHHLKTEGNQTNSIPHSENHRPDNTDTVNDQIPLKYGSIEEFKRYRESEGEWVNIPTDNERTTSLMRHHCPYYEEDPYPRYISMYPSIPRSSRNIQLHYTSEDLMTAQWQAKQIVTSYIDNTINHILDTRVDQPLPTGSISETNTTSLALNMAQFVNHLPGDNTVENEGILMAISAHGLQNANDDEDIDLCDSSPERYSSKLRFSPLPPEEDLNEKDSGPSGNTDNADAYYGNSDNDDQLQLINAAVLYAINSKGLTASGTDYG